MLLEIDQVLARLLPELFDGQVVSVARVRTTRPVFLVFLRGCERPTCAVQFGPQAELAALHDVLRTLHARLPEHVGQSLACAAFAGETWVLVQEGMPGVPWFHLREDVKGREKWLHLRARALDALSRLSGAIAAERRWVAPVDVRGELRRQADRFLSARPGALAWEGALRSEIGSLDRIPEVEWPAQHGDFCLNNLLVSDDRLAIIDFEEFGQTFVPLHDELSLALSFHEFMKQTPSAPLLADHVLACVQPTLRRADLPDAWLRPLFLHHLLWRINQCGDRPTRERVCRELTELLREAIAGGPGWPAGLLDRQRVKP